MDQTKKSHRVKTLPANSPTSLRTDRVITMKTENAFGPHLMLDLHKCDRKILVDKEKMRSLLSNLPGQIGMTRISEPHVMTYKDKWAETPGVTGFVILAESHISLHTFPDDDYVFLDIFSCRNFDYESVKGFLVRFFGSQSPKTHLVERGEEFHKRPAIPKVKEKIIV